MTPPKLSKSSGPATRVSSPARRSPEPYGPRIAELADGQSPFAVVLGCSDSRVPIETIFDQVPGNVFVVRVAGNFFNDDNLGSIEFGVDVLKAQTGRRARPRQLRRDDRGARLRARRHRAAGHIQSIVDATVAPAVRAARGFAGDWLENAIAQNVALNATALMTRSNIVGERGRSRQRAGDRWNL